MMLFGKNETNSLYDSGRYFCSIVSFVSGITQSIELLIAKYQRSDRKKS